MENGPVRAEYQRLAGEYEHRWCFYIGATTRETLARLIIRPGDRVLDAGCGTGALLKGLMEMCPQARLSGIDPVPEMLAIARAKLPEAVELRQAQAEQLPFGDESFDAVLSCSVLHYIRQPAAAVTEMKRVLRRGGQLVITDWCRDFVSTRLCDFYLRLFNAAHFKTYRIGEVESLLAIAGFSSIEIQAYKINRLWGLMTATAKKNAG